MRGASTQHAHLGKVKLDTGEAGAAAKTAQKNANPCGILESFGMAQAMPDEGLKALSNDDACGKRAHERHD